MQPQTRKQMIQKIHIGKAELKMDRECYTRFLLETVDKHSCTVMTDSELMIVLKAMQAKGFRVKSKHKGRKPTLPPITKDRVMLMNKVEALLTENKLSWQYADRIAINAFNLPVNALDVAKLYKLVQMLAVYSHRHGRRTR
ncbi:phage protein GemA/Gp16 family protein [Conservatibacter flavescens]|uniref:Regulatory protein GemA n=1 Tax=Conservatibacter flavescens TaxID=28161 RepID=A0A2M8S4W9_9PAST|nr:phage protein GemA/Gp16 family protein [Conservatibacter flavescens]PJG86196.1 regulatory protein GemA [Conservatibacter flavescens]